MEALGPLLAAVGPLLAAHGSLLDGSTNPHRGPIAVPDRQPPPQERTKTAQDRQHRPQERLQTFQGRPNMPQEQPKTTNISFEDLESNAPAGGIRTFRNETVLWLSTKAVQLIIPIGDDSQLMSDDSGAWPLCWLTMLGYS